MNENTPVCFAWPLTVVADRTQVHLIAGEDIRYTLPEATPTESFLAWLRSFEVPQTMAASLAALPAAEQVQARQWAEQLQRERVLVPAAALQFRGQLPVGPGSGEGAVLVPPSIVVQDTLDYAAAWEANKAQIEKQNSWIWVSVGPGTRGYVSPVFLPHAGPCLGCLLLGFQDRSSTPWVYDVLTAHKQGGGEIRPLDVPAAARAMLVELAQWKSAAFGMSQPSPAVYQLHVLEFDRMEITAHEVWSHPACVVCCGRRS